MLSAASACDFEIADTRPNDRPAPDEALRDELMNPHSMSMNARISASA
jgi:hypothetical protein